MRDVFCGPIKFLLFALVAAVFLALGAMKIKAEPKNHDADSAKSQQGIPSVSLGGKNSRLKSQRRSTNPTEFQSFETQSKKGPVTFLDSRPIPPFSTGRQFDPDARFVRNELLVDGVPKGLEIGLRQLGFRVLEREKLTGLETEILRLQIPSGKNVYSARQALRNRFPGLLVALNHEVDLAQRRVGRNKRFGPGRSKTGSFAREIIGWENVPQSCGRGVKLGMIDSGVDLGHPALKGQQITYRSFHNRLKPHGPRVHGTSVAGLLVGKFSSAGFGGLLPGAHLLAANIFELDRRGQKRGNVYGLVKALDWLAKSKVHVINLSIAMASNKMVQKHIRNVQKQGIIIVAAAGNWGREDKPAYPAAYHQVVAVTAIDRDFRLYKWANRGRYIEFSAPGVDIWTAVPGGGKFQSGTSFASPFMTAVLGVEVARGGGAQISVSSPPF